MNRVPVIVGGAAKNARLSVIVGGVEKQVHDAYVIVGGVAKRFYQRAVTWTEAISGSGIGYGNSLQASAKIVAAIDPAAGHSMFCTVTYTFQTPILMKSGQTLTISSYIFQMQYANFAVAINGGANVFSTDATYGGGTYTFPADTAVSSISASVNGESEEILNNQFPEADLMVTVNSSDYGSFLLNNSGTSDQS